MKWAEIATQDWYRTADTRDKVRLQNAWLEQIAPQEYPQIMTNFRARRDLAQYVRDFDMPPPLENEQEIITPTTLSMHNIRKIETNPLFAEKSYKEQQQLKDVWYRKLSATDPEFQQLGPNEQREFYKKLMTRAPALESGSTLLFGEFETEDQITQAQRWSKTRKIVESTSMNLANAFFQGFGSLIAAPIRLLTGEDSQFTKVVNDMQKQSDWLSTVASEHSRFLTSTLPTFVGYGLGLVTGPFRGLEKLLAGRAVVGGGKGIVSGAPGLLARGGAKIGLRAPDIAYRTTGGALAGALQGLAETQTTDIDVKTALAYEATAGVAFEFLSRYFGMMRQVRRVAKAMGRDPKRMFKAPLQLGSPSAVDPEVERLFKVNPATAAMQNQLYSVDPRGVLRNLRESEQGVKLYSEILGYDEPEVAESFVRLKKGGEVVEEFRSTNQELNIRNAVDYLEDDETAWEAWQNTSAGKRVSEYIDSLPSLEMRLGVAVPEAARKYLTQRLSDFGVTGLDIYKDPKANTEAIDRVYTILRGSRSGKKAAEALSSYGIQLDPASTKANRQAVLQLRKELETIAPENSYTIINERNGNVMSMDENPVLYLEHPELKNLYVPGGIMQGNAQDIREYITKLNKQYRNEKSAITRFFKSRKADLYRFNDSEIVELKLEVPFENRTKQVQLHFKSLKDAQDFLSTGQRSGYGNAADKFFRNNNRIQHSYEQFVKSMKKYNPTEYGKSFLPYKYAAEVARQEGFYLGVLRGNYIVQDIAAGNDINVRTFKNLDEVFDFLKGNDGRLALPDFAGPLSARAVEAEYPRGLAPLVQDLPKEQVKRNRKFTLRDLIPRWFAPSRYVFERFERMAGVDALREKGYGPVSIYNNLRDMIRYQDAFRSRNLDQLRQAKGVERFGKKKGELLSRHLEALDNEVERANAPIRNLEYELKDEVYQEMVSEFGTRTADDLVAASTRIRRFMDDMFSLSGLDGEKYIKHYFPHMREMGERFGGGLSNRLDPKKITQIPDVDKRAFFEIMREADPNEFWWTRDLDQALDNYVNAMSRVVTVRPVMKNLANVVRETTENLSRQGATPNDYRNFVNYLAGIFENIEGVKGVGDEVFRYATENTLDTLTDFVNKKFKTNFKFRGRYKLLRTLLTLTTGAHIAARPWPVFRNLTQSMLTGGSTIGLRWIFSGYDQAMRPGAYEYLRRAGIIPEQVMPHGAGLAMGPRNLLEKGVFWGMRPYKWADSTNRAAVYYGMIDRIDNAFELYRKGQISAKQFPKKAGANLFGKEQYNQAVSLLNTNDIEAGFEAFKDRLARIAVDETQFLYNSIDRPAMFRSSIGRLFGQYTTWPLNYYNLAKNKLMSDSMTAAQKIGFFARLTTVIGAISTSLHAAGLNPATYAPWNAMTFEGGPYFQLLNDMLSTAQGDIGAFKNTVRALTSLIPFGYEGEGIYRAIEAYKDGDPYEAFLHVASAPIRLSAFPRRDSYMDYAENVLVDYATRTFQTGRDTDIIAQIKDETGINFGL